MPFRPLLCSWFSYKFILAFVDLFLSVVLYAFRPGRVFFSRIGSLAKD